MRGELDWIVMKCLEKDRTRRYETANGLARDVQRYLADEPVEARPPSAGYRVRKFVRRNRGRVLAAGLLFLVLVAGVDRNDRGADRGPRPARRGLASGKASRRGSATGPRGPKASTRRVSASRAGSGQGAGGGDRTKQGSQGGRGCADPQ